jgi:3D (Asp-Asp-Asp) domain-containing protein
VVAVDPQVIPLGTQLYVEGYGYARALDVGPAITGNRIDVFLDSADEARHWGVRRVKVYILE